MTETMGSAPKKSQQPGLHDVPANHKNRAQKRAQYFVTTRNGHIIKADNAADMRLHATKGWRKGAKPIHRNAAGHVRIAMILARGMA